MNWGSLIFCPMCSVLWRYLQQYVLLSCDPRRPIRESKIQQHAQHNALDVVRLQLRIGRGRKGTGDRGRGNKRTGDSGRGRKGRGDTGSKGTAHRGQGTGKQGNRGQGKTAGGKGTSKTSHVCVFSTTNPYFYPSTFSTPSVPPASSFKRDKIPALWAQTTKPRK